jgi:hypothetical protein
MKGGSICIFLKLWRYSAHIAVPFFTADVDLPEVRQEFIEDCPVCCRPVTITVVFDKDGACHAEVHGEDT